MDMERAYYSGKVENFYLKNCDEILGEIVRNNQFALEKKQRNTWIYEIQLLQNSMKDLINSYIIFEYTIPRMGDRIDNVLINNGIIYLIEFKVGENAYPKHAIDQVFDYALDLKYFHKESNNKKIVPICVCTNAPEIKNEIVQTDGIEDGIFKPVCCNKTNLKQTLEILSNKLNDNYIDPLSWINSQYMPTPTIIEAAQALYRGHNVKEISRNDSDAYNLSLTTEEINKIIDYAKNQNQKCICFITGVPGAGKTLAGLNIANIRHNFDEDEHAVFLSGNGPLVYVLREALARDEAERLNIQKGFAKRKANAFIQNVHHFRDDAIKSNKAPIERVVVFDEAQRAWTREKTAKFMSEKGEMNWDLSEPEFLISIMDRHKDWAVIICLIGGGQEINTGEAGLPEWFSALRLNFSHWKVFISKQIHYNEYTQGVPLEQLFKNLSVNVIDKLHLAVSVRSFRSEKVSEFVKLLLDVNINSAKKILLNINSVYPIILTRNLDVAKNWVKTMARGTERYGIIASSGAKRLKSFGIWIQNNITPENWFLNKSSDVRSSYYLEDTATEFDIQGLEIDWAIVAWDADLRFENGNFEAYNFIGSRWNTIKKEIDKMYLKNAYRVLLTRARQGLIIFIPEGNEKDYTRKIEYYDGTYNYLKSIGIKEI